VIIPKSTVWVRDAGTSQQFVVTATDLPVVDGVPDTDTNKLLGIYVDFLRHSIVHVDQAWAGTIKSFYRSHDKPADATYVRRNALRTAVLDFLAQTEPASDIADGLTRLVAAFSPRPKVTIRIVGDAP
jgi:hypothetical protein